MKTAIERNGAELLAALRAKAIQFESITELKMSRCTGFVVHETIVACAYADLIAVRLPRLSVIALLRTPGCRRYQPYGRASLANWLAVAATSPAICSLEQLFEEAIAFASESRSSKTW
jgi:hypothetical protein